MWVRSGQQRTERARRSGRRAVSLHGDDGVHEIEPRAEMLVQIDEHSGKVHGVGIAIMILRLDRAGDRTEKILRRSGKGEHAVALELAEADDGIGVVQIGRVGNVLCHARVRQVGLPLGKVPVERAARLLDGRKAAGTVDGVQMPRCIGTAWAVAHDDGRAAPDERLRQDPQQHRMGRCGPLRLHGRDKVDLDDNAHAFFHPVQPTKRGERLCERSSAFFRVIAFAGNNRNIDSHI